MTRGSSPALEATRVDGYLIFLFALLSTATLFDGFDAAMFSFAAPDVRAALDISREQWGYISGAIPAAISVVAIGPMVGALLVLRYAPETRGLSLEEVQVKLATPQRGATSSEK
jgi:hypothetical protein